MCIRDRDQDGRDGDRGQGEDRDVHPARQPLQARKQDEKHSGSDGEDVADPETQGRGPDRRRDMAGIVAPVLPEADQDGACLLYTSRCV